MDEESHVLGTLTPEHVHLLSVISFQFHQEEVGYGSAKSRRDLKNGCI